MTETKRDVIDVALALVEFEVNFDVLEGVLLAAGGGEQLISPAVLASDVGIARQDAEDILLQLRRVDAVSPSPGDSSMYAVNPRISRELFSKVREARGIIGQYQQRQPVGTEVKPLVTLPRDPHFKGVVPESLQMNWLMPTLARMIKRATGRILILTPYFEGGGLDRLEAPLLDALAEGVEVTIVTRYLHDSDSINRSVLTELWEEALDRGIDTERLELIDYTVWDSKVPEVRRNQDGETPAFTLHAKLMIVDEREAYVGSANVTDYGFARYLELGVRLSGPAVEGYSEIGDRLLASESATRWRPG